ncbi:MAG: ATP synthase F1 subunit delta, partial [Calditrichia bacterium]|nr:ATP synthase F1 subunit delta [Calditrichia bacterium]
MKKHRASKRYAAALFELSKEEKVVDVVSENMTIIGNILESNSDLIQVLESPDVAKEDKNQILQKLFKAFIKEIHPTVNNLMRLLLEKNREMLIPEIIDWYLEMEDEYKNIQRAE